MHYRQIAEQKIGRKLLPGEVVHHLNGDHNDDRPKNLKVLPSNGEHMQLHAYLRDTNPHFTTGHMADNIASIVRARLRLGVSTKELAAAANTDVSWI